MPRWTTSVGHRLAKVLGIDVQEPEDIPEDFLGKPGEVFYENQPTTAEFLKHLQPTPAGTLRYFQSLFPFISWIGYYNTQWLIGDLVAGITIGAVVVPQSLAYARLATLNVQFGLYSSFMGHLIYWIFGTSKDISIGPIAMMSVLTAKIIEELRTVYPEVPAHVIAAGLGIVAGAFILALGMIRCGWIIDLIPLVSLSAFVTGSAITIGSSQLPSLLGVSGVKTSESPFNIIINTLKRLPHAHGLDTAVGLSALFLLYLIRYLTGRVASTFPKYARAAFFVATLRTVFVILLFTFISWLVNKGHRQEPSFKILKTVPTGFQNVGIPPITTGMVKKLIGFLPASVIILLLEHIAIAKSFGRINNYTINPSQEMVAIGAGNILGAFLGGYPSTGSFSRTAIQAKAGSRSPASGIITALVVLLAIYVLPPVFYYIPSATLGAVIIHAVGDLFTPPKTLYRFWRISPFEVFIFFIGVIVAVFSTIDMGIYTTVGLSVAILLIRNLRTRGDFLGRVRVHTMVGDRIIGDHGYDSQGSYNSASKSELFSSSKSQSETSSFVHGMSSSPAPSTPGAIPSSAVMQAARNVFLPLGHVDGTNPEVGVDSPYPGIFIYRFNEGFNFPGASHTLAHLIAYIQANARPGTDPRSVLTRLGDRPWNNPGGSRFSKKDRDAEAAEVDSRPLLKAVILDFSSVNNVDVTSVQQLVDVRNQLDRYAAPNVVDWHMACIRNRWTKRALVAAGFGYPTQRPDANGVGHRWQNIFSVAEIGTGSGMAAGGGAGRGVVAAKSATGVVVNEVADQSAAEKSHHHTHSHSHSLSISTAPAETEDDMPKSEKATASHIEVRHVVVSGANRPLFHVDLTSALQSAIIMAK